MKQLEKQEINRLVYSALLGIGLVLILVSMLTTGIEKPVDPYSVSANYYKTAQGIDISISQGIRLLVLGILSGIIGGMMGMGGGVVKASGLMIVFGVEVLLVRTIALITNIFIYGSAAYRHTKANGLVLKDLVKLMIPGALIGVAFGFILGNLLHAMWLKKLLGLFALVSALDMLRKMYLNSNNDDGEPEIYTDEQYKKENKIKIAGAGIPMGAVMGLFGISGGVIGVPYQTNLLGVPMKNAIANTSITSFFASTFALLVALWYEYTYGMYSITTPIVIALWIIPGNVLGAQFGSYLTGMLPLRFINFLYVFLMLIIGLKLFI